jgi:hypothetical protein
MASITKILCECNALYETPELDSPVIKEIFSTFLVLYPQITHFRLSGLSGERELLIVY